MYRHCTFRLMAIFGIVAILAATFGISCTSRTQDSANPGGPEKRSSSGPVGIAPGAAKDRIPGLPTPTTDAAPSPRQLPTKPAVKGSAKGTPGPAPSGPTEATINVEKIGGYKIPAEYLVIPSRHFSDAVVAVALPLNYEKELQTRYPLVIAFSGAGECVKPPRQGSLAWIGDYKADEAVKALETGRLDKADFRGLATLHELRFFNRMLQEHPYRGIILVCPYSPPLPMAHGLEVKEYEEFIIKELIPELKRRYRVAPKRVGVDGVSMGGARAMYYGFKYPEIFSTIGSVQGAFGAYIGAYRDLVKKNRDVLLDRAIQLVTSDRDPMAPSVERMHQMLEEARIPHQYLKLTGPHDYVFNQGPGSLSLLVFHNSGPGLRSPGPVR